MINNTIITTMGLSNTSSLNILQVIYGIDTRVLVQGPDGQLHDLKLYYDSRGPTSILTVVSTQTNL